MKKLQDQSMERDLRKIVRKKLDEMTFIEDSVDRWSPDSHSSDPLGDLGDERRGQPPEKARKERQTPQKLD